MSEPEDKWPLPDYITGPPKHVHALGVISLNFNIFESSWITLLAPYAGEETARFLLLGKTPDEWRIATVRHYATRHEGDPDILKRIFEIADAYAICAENRHILMHSKQFFALNKMDRLSVWKHSNQGNILRFHFHHNQLRRVADDMMDGIKYLMIILEHLMYRDGPEILRATDISAWPDKPLSPRKLDPAEILEVQQDD
jgi:hypothetical protein